MLLRQVLLFVIILLAVRILRVVMQRYAVRRSRETETGPAQGIHMVRDPVCGTFVVPDRAVVLAEGSQRVYFCSASCRDTYRDSSSRPDYPEGRTA
jgi:hypothetical protein